MARLMPCSDKQFRRSKAGFFLKVVGNDDLAGMECIAGRRLQIDALGIPGRSSPAPIRHLRSPVTFFLRHVLQDLGEGCFETLRAELRRSLQYLADVAGLQRGSAELAQQGLLLNRYGVPVSLQRSTQLERYGLFPRRGWHEFVLSKSRRLARLGCSMISCPVGTSSLPVCPADGDRARNLFPSVWCWARHCWKTPREVLMTELIVPHLLPCRGTATRQPGGDWL